MGVVRCYNSASEVGTEIIEQINTYSVGIFGIEDGGLAPEHKVVALSSQKDSNLATKENKGEAVAELVRQCKQCTADGSDAHLLLVGEEKGQRVVSVLDSRADPRQPVEH